MCKTKIESRVSFVVFNHLRIFSKLGIPYLLAEHNKGPEPPVSVLLINIGNMIVTFIHS